MPRHLIASLTVLLAACAGASGLTKGPATPRGGAPTEEDAVSGLAQRVDEQARHLGELEARLALLEQEARFSRNDTAVKPKETIRIGRSTRASEDSAWDGSATESESTSDEPVPSLRLAGGSEETQAQPWEPPPAPSGAPDGLAVVPLPGTSAGIPPDPVAAVPLPVAGATAREDYRAALRLVRERDFERAMGALDAFLTAHPDDALTDDAAYWRGEVRYAQRRYREALDQFSEVLARFPNGNRVPDALLKVGMCHHRLGDDTAARSYYERVRHEFPDTEAARLVPEEGSS